MSKAALLPVSLAPASMLVVAGSGFYARAESGVSFRFRCAQLCV